MTDSQAKAPRVVVIGAGWIGGPTADLLARKGYAVTATTRSGTPRIDPVAPAAPVESAEPVEPVKPVEPLRAGVTYVPFDVSRDGVDGLKDLIRGAATVIVCWAPSGRSADRQALYLGGAQVVAQACAAERPSRLIYTSSTSALPDRNEAIHEDCAQWPTSDRGRLQREAEKVILEGGTTAQVPVAVLRLAGLYGPGRELGRIYRRDPAAVLSGSGCAPTNLIHRDDVLQAIASAVDLPASWSGVIHVCADDHRSRREIFAAVARREGLADPVWELPAEQPRGKSVGNRLLREVLGVTLLHPRHDTGGPEG